MVCFEDSEENGQSFFNVSIDSKAGALKQRFRVYPSMLRPSVSPNLEAMRKLFPPELTSSIRDTMSGGPAYFLKSVLKETESDDAQPPLLGRRIVNDIVRWGPNCLKIIGDFTHIALYWEWTEDVIARCSKRLKDANIYDAVYASLYSYDRDPHVVRAFSESWCPSTNTLHTIEGEWSISLWDLHKIGGLPIVGRRYDEAIPSARDMRSSDTGRGRLIPRACEHLFVAYCFLAALPDARNGVRATQWVQYWCKQAHSYPKPVKRRHRKPDAQPKNNSNPRREIPEKPLEWSPEEMDVFKELGVMDDTDRKTTYLAAYLSCWLCAFVLPEEMDPMIRPTTFEVAAHMAKGVTFSLATPVLSSLYHGLNKMANAEKPTYSGSAFPSHYLYGWLAYYFDTHHLIDNAPPGPLMVQYSGSQGAKSFEDVGARNLIHEGSLFKASSLVLRGNHCGSVYDNKLDLSTFSYIISLRTAYLPLRFKSSFFLEPYHPTRFSRQFGFHQDIPGILPRSADDGSISYDIALKHLRLLLFRGSQTKVMLPGRFSSGEDMTTPSFKQWWAKVTVTDLRENVSLLVSSVNVRGKNKATVLDTMPAKANGVIQSKPASPKKITATNRPEKRGVDDSDWNEDVNYKHRRVCEMKSAQVCRHLFGQDEDSGSDSEEVPRFVAPAPTDDVAIETLDDNGGESSTQLVRRGQKVSDASSSSEQLQDNKASSVEVVTITPPSSQAVKLTNQIVKVLLQNLMEATPVEVKNIAAQASSILANLRNADEEISIFQGIVDAYVKSVAKFLAVQQAVASHTAEVSAVEDNLHSARATCQGAVRTSRSLEKHGKEVAKAIEAAETKLQGLRDEAQSIKQQQSRQAGVVSVAESDVDALHRRLDELRASRASSDDLAQAQSELDQCKKAIEAAMH